MGHGGDAGAFILHGINGCRLMNDAVLEGCFHGRGIGLPSFFMDRRSDRLYLNEVNTIPGFTAISMYPRLWVASGMSLSGSNERVPSKLIAAVSPPV